VKTAADALRDAAARLAAVSDTARLDAELLMAHAAGVERGALLLRLRDMEEPEGFAALVARRLAHEPVAQIVGYRDFWTLRLRVSRDVLTPRPDSETLIEAAIAHFAARAAPRRILDLGTGSGALLLAALDHWPEATGIGIDISTQAIEISHENAISNGLAARATFQQGDWLTGLSGPFDLILANPPYIKMGVHLPRDVLDYEPAGALFAGEDGLDAYRVIAPRLADHLADHGVAAIEIGHDQGEDCLRLFSSHGLRVTLRHDLGGRDRCIVVTR
jgi:release factor glutamine methyltransferase